MHKISALVFLAVGVLSEAFGPIAPEIHVPKPYKFGYTVKDKHGEQHREETGDGVGAVKGSYGFTDERGIHRQVNYIADKAGFRAEVKTNEHGTAPLNPAAVKMISSAHPYLGGAGVLGGLGPLAAASAPLAAAPGFLAAGRGSLAAAPGLFSAGRGPLAAGPGILAAGPGPLAAAPGLFSAGPGPLAAGPGIFAAGPGPLATAPGLLGGLDAGYGGPLLGGAVNGYDARFGVY